jgi:multiple sugar transport system permease protein
MTRRASIVATYALLAVGAVLTVLPLWWMIVASCLPTGAATRLPPRLWPTDATLAHYAELFGRLNLARYTVNSLIVAVTTTAISLLVNSLAGYAFAKLRFPGRDGVFRLLVAALVIPGQVGMLPLFLLLKEVGLINTYGGVIVPGLASIFGIFLVRQYALSIPDTMLDAARIDGAGELRIFWELVLPSCRPILITLGLFTFMGAWNDFLWPLVVLSDGDMFTLPVALANLVGEHVQDTELMMAGAVVAVVPVVALFVALQRFYVAGILAGSLKE